MDKNKKLTFGSLFTGVGGFDLAFVSLNMEPQWQVENNRQCIQVLERHWPEVKRYGDIRNCAGKLSRVDIVCGGDPCPAHSRARSNGPSNHPDLAGYFLAVVGRLRPRWVVRENVPAPAYADFDAALGLLGYGTAIVRVDAAKITGQSRQRDYLIGRYKESRECLRDKLSQLEDGQGTYQTILGTRQVAPALTVHRTRYDSRDCYIYESGQLRILDSQERETLAGFPEGWTAGFSETARAKFYGNAVVPGAARFIGQLINEYEK